MPNHKNPDTQPIRNTLNYEQAETQNAYLIRSLDRIVKPMADVLDLKAFEVYFSDAAGTNLERMYCTGEITPIWQQGETLGKDSYLVKGIRIICL